MVYHRVASQVICDGVSICRVLVTYGLLEPRKFKLFRNQLLLTQVNAEECRFIPLSVNTTCSFSCNK